MRAWLPIGGGLALLSILGSGKNTDLTAHLFGFMAGIILGALYGVLVKRSAARAYQACFLLITLTVLVMSWMRAFGHGCGLTNCTFKALSLMLIGTQGQMTRACLGLYLPSNKRVDVIRDKAFPASDDIRQSPIMRVLPFLNTLQIASVIVHFSLFVST
jgi:hypothetical protein